jgi:hypothetical protein
VPFCQSAKICGKKLEENDYEIRIVMVALETIMFTESAADKPAPRKTPPFAQAKSVKI